MAKDRSNSDPVTMAELNTPATSANKPPKLEASEGATYYTVVETSYIGGELRRPGDKVQFAGKPGHNLAYLSGPQWQEPGANQAV